MKKIDFLLISFFILIAIGIRFLVVREGFFPFWFDVARDAVVSREIIEEKDLKLQGPNASGTNDTVYHGVFYYYIVGPLYTLFGGDPQFVTFALAILSSVTILPIYALTLRISNTRFTAILAVLLFTFSYDAVRSGTWLSNPIIATVSLPAFSYFLWKTFFEKEKKYLPWLALTLGICTQSLVFFALLWGEVFLAWWYTKIKFSTKQWLFAIAVYLLTISTMIFTQIKMITTGLLTLQSLAGFSSTHLSGPTAVITTLTIILNKIIQTTLPSFPVAGVLLFMGTFIFLSRKKLQKELVFFLIILTGPLWILGWHAREMYHGFIGLEAIVPVLLALWLTQLKSSSFGKFALGCILLLYVISNFKMWQTERADRATLYFLPQGSYLREQLQLIDKTYEMSNGAEFSISTLTNPYGYNTTWAYLYDWYGRKKYGRVPLFYGPDQSGIFGGDLLTRTSSPSATHFAISEPKEGIPEYVQGWFKGEQEFKVGTPSSTVKFWSMELEEYRPSPNN